MKKPVKKVAIKKVKDVEVKKLGKETAIKNEIDKDLQKLGNRIKELRIKAGYTNYEYFAYEKNISRAQYGRYEKGEDLRYSNLVRIVKAHGMTMKAFFNEGFD